MGYIAYTYRRAGSLEIKLGTQGLWGHYLSFWVLYLLRFEKRAWQSLDLVDVLEGAEEKLLDSGYRKSYQLMNSDNTEDQICTANADNRGLTKACRKWFVLCKRLSKRAYPLQEEKRSGGNRDSYDAQLQPYSTVLVPSKECPDIEGIILFARADTHG